MRLIPVILCGGAGSRLWPVSRELHPKPFIRLADGQSLLQKTFLRGALLPGVAEILTVTNRELFFKTKDEYKEINHSALKSSFILEPFGRNTAPAVAAAALHVASTYDQETMMLVLPADHLITDYEAFTQAVTTAIDFAKLGKIVTFGITPDAPETGYGYIKAEGNTVLQFAEKPSLEKATEYLQAGNYWWNSGMFCFQAGTMLREFELHCPQLFSAAKRCIKHSKMAVGKEFCQLELEAESFKQIDDLSIDYGVIEKSSNVAVVPCNIGWSDIGSWNAIKALAKQNNQGNSIEGEALLHDVYNCHIQSHQRLIGAVGVENLFIIDTPDALLVADKSRTQEVKHIYSRLKSQGHEAHKLHRTVHRPWGSYTILEERPKFKIKRIIVKPGASLSLQMHHHRSEHWIVVNGMAKVINGDEEIYVNASQSTYIPAGHKHRLENPGVLDLMMIEVQSGEYMGEDDIVRFEDAYGRI